MPANVPGVNRDDIEAAWWDDAAEVAEGECLQPPARSAPEPALLGGPDTVGGCAEARVCAQADLDEHELRPIAHYQIEFARRAVQLAGEQPAARGLQQAQRRVFARIAECLAR